MKLRIALTAFTAFLVLGSPVWAGYTSNILFDGKLNQLQFSNYEMVLRAGSGSGVNDVTINSVTYSVINPFAGTQTGDIIVQVLEATSLTNTLLSAGTPVTGGTLKAYFVAKANTNNTADPTDDYFDPLGVNDTDPFGVFSSPDGATMVRWYLDDDTSFGFANYAGDANQGAALVRIVNSVTDGNAWFDFGIGSAVDTSGFTGGGVEIGQVTTTTFEVTGALNVLNLYGKTIVFFDSQQLDETPADTDSSIEFTQTVKKNGVNAGNYSSTPVSGKSPWYLSSTDPLYLTAVPEPGAIVALLGMLAVALGLFAVRGRTR